LSEAVLFVIQRIVHGLVGVSDKNLEAVLPKLSGGGGPIFSRIGSTRL
jgi:hypothetical protein